ncbi:non-homologous end joining protein Ku [Streptomyces sp. NPDC054933]
MRSTWKGAIGFGLVSIPVALYVATEDHGIPLRMVHAQDGGRIRQKRVCERCGNEVEYRDIARGYEDPAGRTAVLTEDDLADLPLPTKRIIDVVAFVDEVTIDPLALDRAYYVAAGDSIAAKPYTLLREALSRSGKAAVAKVALRTRESLALLRAHGDVLVLHTMYWPDEVRPSDGIAPAESVEVRPQELQMAASLMDALSEDFDLQQLHDDYQHALDQLVTAKLEHSPIQPPELPPAAEGIGDLMAALQASIERQGRKAPAEEPAKKTATKEATAKQPAKKTTTKKTPAKRAAAKKTG